MFKGTFVALVTPFKNGKVDEKKLKELVEWQIHEGINGLVPVGTTGESATLSHEEHERVIEIVVKAANRRVPVLAGAGSNSTSEAVSLTKKAKELGADGVLSVNPYYNRPTQDGLVAHFDSIAKAAPIPVVLYNIPSRTGVKLSVNSIATLAKKNKNIVGVKEATGDLDQASELVQRLGTSFAVLSGEDSLTLPLMAVGARGVISVAANLVPKAVGDMVTFALDNRFDRARALHLKLYPLMKALFLETNPAPIKTAMADAGLLESGELRLPMVPVKPETRTALKNAMKDFGVTIPIGVK